MCTMGSCKVQQSERLSEEGREYTCFRLVSASYKKNLDFLY